MSASRVTTASWGSGFLPTVHQGQSRSVRKAIPVLFVGNPARNGQPNAAANRSTSLRDLNQKHYDTAARPRRIETRIAAYEMAYKMQTSVPEVMDISKEAAGNARGLRHHSWSRVLRQQLPARAPTRGARVCVLFSFTTAGWDHHGGPDGNFIFDLKKRCAETDQPAVALIKDLKQRGLLDETLVLWGGEFGRTPMMQGSLKPDQIGRDHHPHGYTVWMAGGGIKPGFVYGKTDEFGFYAVEDKVHVHDLHATILHQFGIEHTKLTYHFQGRDFRLTDVSGEVVKQILA